MRIIDVKTFGAKGDGVTDDTAAIIAAWAFCRSYYFALWFPDTEDYYLVTDTAITIPVTFPRACILGSPLGVRIHNKAGAGKPTILLSGTQYAHIEGFILTGHTGFPNVGIKFEEDGSANRCGYVTLRNIVAQTNGVGIHITGTNTIWIDNFAYWPSGGGSFGGTTDGAGSRQAAILADGASAVNSVNMRALNISSIDTIANGGAKVRWNTAVVSNDINISESELEGVTAATTRAIDFKHVYGFEIDKSFVENADQQYIDCRYGRISGHGGATASLTIGDGTAPNACNYFDVDTMNVLSITADANCTNINTINVNSANAWANSAVDSRRIGCLDGVTGMLPDIVGRWQTPTFDAAAFTTNGAGGWTVAAGDVSVNRWMAHTGALTMNVVLTATTVTAATGTELRVRVPGSNTVSKTKRVPCRINDNAGGWTTGYVEAVSGNTYVSVYRTQAGTDAWTAAADATAIEFDITFEI